MTQSLLFTSHPESIAPSCSTTNVVGWSRRGTGASGDRSGLVVMAVVSTHVGFRLRMVWSLLLSAECLSDMVKVEREAMAARLCDLMRQYGCTHNSVFNELLHVKFLFWEFLNPNYMRTVLIFKVVVRSTALVASRCGCNLRHKLG